MWSYILGFENAANPYGDRKTSIEGWRFIAVMDVSSSSEIVHCANRILMKGIKKKDALHLACAITAKCQYFLTTDKKLLNKSVDEIIIMNPLDFIRELEV